jgi:6-phosphogluconolactonase
MSAPNVEVFNGPDDLAGRAAGLIRAAAAVAVGERGRFTLALAGGSTPEKAYRLLAADDGARWDRTLLFFGDERFVPADDPRSNLAMVRRSLLTGPVTAARVFPVPTARPSAADAARAYAATLAAELGVPPDGPPPRFDMVLLGLGDDGHTASLFPGQPALSERDAWVVSSPPGVLPPPVDRVTFTFPTLNAARAVLFLVAGANKAEALRDVLEGGADRERRPAAGVRPTAGSVTWLIDEAAAGLLSRR